MGLTKTPLSMLEAKGSPNSDVRFTGTEVVTQLDEDINNTGVVSGIFDDASGTLILTLVNGTQISIPGFMTHPFFIAEFFVTTLSSIINLSGLRYNI